MSIRRWFSRSKDPRPQPLDPSALDEVRGGVFASKKGYDHYVAQSANASAGAMNNPLYTENTNQGEAGDAFEDL